MPSAPVLPECIAADLPPAAGWIVVGIALTYLCVVRAGALPSG